MAASAALIEWSCLIPRSRPMSCSFLFGSMQLAFYGVRALIAARTQPWCLRSVCFHVLESEFVAERVAAPVTACSGLSGRV